jgi:hypothetical protein
VDSEARSHRGPTPWIDAIAEVPDGTTQFATVFQIFRRTKTIPRSEALNKRVTTVHEAEHRHA